MNATAKLSSKGQIVVPKSIRDENGWTEGMEFEFVKAETGVTLKPVKPIDRRFPPITWEEFEARRVRIERFPTDSEIEETLLSEAARRFDAAHR